MWQVVWFDKAGKPQVESFEDADKAWARCDELRAQGFSATVGAVRE